MNDGEILDFLERWALKQRATHGPYDISIGPITVPVINADAFKLRKHLSEQIGKFMALYAVGRMLK